MMKGFRLFHIFIVLLCSVVTLVAGVMYSTHNFEPYNLSSEQPDPKPVEEKEIRSGLAGTNPGPDAIVGDLFGLAQFGSSGTQVGLAMGTEVCNAGAVDIDWFALPNNDHPVVPQNLYRMSGGASNDDRFEQIGQSSVQHAFFALASNSCGFGCNGVSGSHLGSGCSNPDSPSINAGPNLGSRAWINPFTGFYPGSNPNPNDHLGHTHNGVSHRLLVEMNDLNTSLNPGAAYYAEAQYVIPHEGSWCQSHAGECNMYNNVSYRRFSVTGTSFFSFSAVGSTVQMQPAIYAWPGATRVQIEPDPGNDGIGVVGYKVTNPSPGVWHYEYAIYNENIDRAIQSFSIPAGANITLSNIGFHAPPQHPGWAADGTVGNAGFSSAPWAQAQAGGFMTWSSETFVQNQNANAMRWGTLYNFRFDSDKPPQNVNATIGFFKTGGPITVSVQGPEAGPTPTPTPCLPAGSLDTSFNGTGTVVTPIGSSADGANGVAIQSDGKIVAAGSSGNVPDFALVRYNFDGTLDTSFNGTGKVVTPIGSSADGANGVAIQSDGKIVAAGYSGGGFAVVRYNSDGTLDTTFNGNGKVVTQIGNSSRGQSIVIQSDGKIVVGGQGNVSGIEDFALARYNTNGSPDTAFNVTGNVITPVGTVGGEACKSVAIQPDGKIVAAGYVGSLGAGSNADIGLARYNADGSLDTTFNGTGKIITPIGNDNDFGSSVALQTDGRIVVAGRSINGQTIDSFDVALVRYNTDGTLDNTFNGTGKVITNLDSTGPDGANSVTIQADGRILAAGFSGGFFPFGDFALVRYNQNGTLDNTFNGTGAVVTHVGNSPNYATSVAIHNGRIVAAGVSNNGSNPDFAVAAYNQTGCPAGSISGNITYGNAIGAPNPRFVSNVMISGAGSPNVSTTSNFPGGAYALTGFGAGSYTITPTKTTGANGITSLDAAKIAQHIAGVSTLTGNQLIVADTSGNGTISSFDAGQVARYVAGLTGFGAAGNWIFSPVNRSYAAITTAIAGEDYSALLMGEVSGNWTNTGARPMSSRQLAVSGGTEKPVAVDVPNIVATAGKEVSIPINVEGTTNKQIISYEFDLRYDPSVIQPQVDPVDVAGTARRGLSFVVNAQESGLLRIVVYGAMPIDQNGVLLNLRFTVVGAPGSVSPLTWERILFNEGLPVTATGGQIEIANPR